MKLGILVNADSRLKDILGVTREAAARGHEVRIFVMDSGTRLLENAEFTGLCALEGVRMAYCDHNRKGLGVNKEGIPERVACGSQFDNAVMAHEADRLIVL